MDDLYDDDLYDTEPSKVLKLPDSDTAMDSSAKEPPTVLKLQGTLIDTGPSRNPTASSSGSIEKIVASNNASGGDNAMKSSVTEPPTVLKLQGNLTDTGPSTNPTASNSGSSGYAGALEKTTACDNSSGGSTAFVNTTACDIDPGQVTVHPTRRVYSVVMPANLDLQPFWTFVRDDVISAVHHVKPLAVIDDAKIEQSFASDASATICEKLMQTEAELLVSNLDHLANCIITPDWDVVKELMVELAKKGEKISDPDVSAYHSQTWQDRHGWVADQATGCSPDTCMKWMQDTGYPRGLYTCDKCGTASLSGMHWHCVAHKGDLCPNCARAPTKADYHVPQARCVPAQGDDAPVVRLDSSEWKSCERPSVKEEMPSEFLEALTALHQKYKDDDSFGLSTCLSTIRIYLNNIVRNPGEQKFQRINCENVNFQQRIIPFEGAMAVLQACGFHQSDDCLILDPGFDPSRLPDALVKLDALLD
jgi:hypothetical protein